MAKQKQPDHIKDEWLYPDSFDGKSGLRMTCDHCKSQQTLTLPLQTRVMAGAIFSFIRLHRKCQPRTAEHPFG